MTFAPFTAQLPWPPSVNNSRLPGIVGGRARLIRSKDSIAWTKTAAMHLLLWHVPKAALAVSLAVVIEARPIFRGRKDDLRRRDLDNLVKPVLDVLKQHGAIADDRWVDRIEVRRAQPCEGGLLIVTVLPHALITEGAKA